MSQQLINELTKEQLKTDLPEFKAGDTVRVHVRIVEGSRERIQVFEGVVIKRRGGGISETFTVRKISYGVGVERTFPVHSPKIEKIEVTRRGRVRRAKLYYLRNLRGKAARIREIRNRIQGVLFYVFMMCVRESLRCSPRCRRPPVFPIALVKDGYADDHPDHAPHHYSRVKEGEQVAPRLE